MSEPDPSKAVFSATDTLREPPDDRSFEADLAGLAARFTHESGGGLSPELSAELALEIVLNEIVEQACLSTGATGAAIVLERDGEMTCRASSGPTAPELGSRLETLSGLSGECVCTRRTQWSDDAWSDPRADAEASERLGVRSVIVMPLLREDRLVGVFELFSTQPYAFGVRDERVLELLAERTLKSLDSAVHALDPEPVAVPEPLADPHPLPPMDEPAANFTEVKQVVDISEHRTESSKSRPLDAVTWALGAAVLGAAVLVGIVLGRHLVISQSARAQNQGIVSGSESRPATTQLANVPKKMPERPAKAPAQAKTNSWVATPPGGLLVFDRGKEVFRLPPGKNSGPESAPVQPAAELEPESAMQVPQESAERELIHRVEPLYPEAARQQNIQGEVVLEVHIAADGSVQEVQVVSGLPPLTQASTEAVRQWKFRKKMVNGRAVETQTRITLTFRLPAQAMLTTPN
jgi:L-methionine (R)-S-oxide reductase